MLVLKKCKLNFILSKPVLFVVCIWSRRLNKNKVLNRAVVNLEVVFFKGNFFRWAWTSGQLICSNFLRWYQGKYNLVIKMIWAFLILDYGHKLIIAVSVKWIQTLHFIFECPLNWRYSLHDAGYFFQQFSKLSYPLMILWVQDGNARYNNWIRN